MYAPQRLSLSPAASIGAVTREIAEAAIRASLAEAPRTFPVAWFDGAEGPRGESADLDASALVADLRALLATPRPKGEGLALLPAATDPDRTDRERTAVLRVTFAHVDHDGGAVTMADAAEVFARLDVAAILYPSPSAPHAPPERTTRWRALVALAGSTPAGVYLAHAPVVRATFTALFGRGVDPSTYVPERLAFVHPRPHVLGGRPPSDLIAAGSLALDVEALTDAAITAGWWHRTPARDARRAGVRDGAALVEVLGAAGYVLGAADARGFAAARCPGDAWHGSVAAGRRDTSCVVHVSSGAWLCAHAHSLAPDEADRGAASTSTLLRWALRERPDLAPAFASARDVGRLRSVVAELRDAPFDEAPRREVHPAAVTDDMAEALAVAVRRSRFVLYTPNVGAGKTTAVGPALAPVLRDGSLRPAGETAAPKASAAVLVKDLAARASVAASVLRAGFAVRVHTPAHLVVDPATGKHACRHRRLALEVYGANANVRASLCPSVPGVSGAPSAPCEFRDACLAADPWVPYELGADGAAHPNAGAPRPPGELWVAVATHAAAPSLALRDGAPLIVDEADPALRMVVEGLDAADLEAAVERARITAPARIVGERTPSSAPRIVALAVAECALATGLDGLAAVPPDARRAWVAAAITRGVSIGHAGVRQDLVRWAPPPDGASRDEDIAEACAAAWMAHGAGAHAITLRGGERPSKRGGEALRALARWARGCHARIVEADGERRLALAWRSVVAEAAAAVLSRGGGVLALDATGSPDLARAALGAESVTHDPVRVDGGAEVRRVLVASRRVSRRNIAPREGAPRWRDAVLPALRAARAALASQWRDGYGIGPGVVFAPRQLALVCATLAAAGIEASPEAVRAEAERRCDEASSVTPALRARVVEWSAAADDETRRTLDAFEVHGAVHWTHYGASDARGSDAHRHRAWSLTLGDARPNLTATTDALWASTGAAPTSDGVRLAMNRAASAEHEQAHGRLRALQRHGERLVAVHVGAVPPLGWFALPAPPVVVSLAAAVEWGRDPVTSSVSASPDAADAAEAAVVRVALDAAAPAPTAVADLHAAHAAGWSMGEVAAAVGAGRDTVRAWWRGETAPRALRHVEALRALAEGRESATLRARYLRLASGRGWSRLWRGAPDAAGLAKRLHGLGVRISLDAVTRWASSGGDLDASALGALAALYPVLAAVFPPVRPTAETPPPWPPVEVRESSNAKRRPRAPRPGPAVVRAPRAAPPVRVTAPGGVPSPRGATDG